ncbi:MAG: hypothetical protein IPF59_13955, partial [Ignavibacteria bacterium]|nr:hypothetical protein [Ignavibacteria bacterium]
GRGVKEYDRYLLKTTYESVTQTKMFISDMLRGDTTEKLSVILNAQCNVVSVTVDGQEKEKQLVIRDFRRITQRDTVDLLPTGTKVRCWFSDSGSAYTINDAPAPDSIVNILVEVVKGEGGSRTGNVLDAKKPVAVGEKWKMNIAAFRKVLGPDMSKLMKKITGVVTFRSIDSTGAQPTATVAARASAEVHVGLRAGTFQCITRCRLFTYGSVGYALPPVGLITSTKQRIVTAQGVARMELEISTNRSASFLR